MYILPSYTITEKKIEKKKENAASKRASRVNRNCDLNRV
jgi:hypothetical protein